MEPLLRACRFMPQFVSGAVLSLAVTSAFAQPASASAAQPGTCGRISVFDSAPRSQDLYRARLINIDGRAAGPARTRTYRVPAGRHTLEVAEAIDVRQFDDVELRQRNQRMDRYKTLEVDVKPDTTYLLAAHLIESGRIADGSYWEPVIYGQSTEACK